MHFLIGLIAFVFMLSVIVIIHELGHFLVARHYGVYCREFSIGMGPALYQHQGKETIFSIRAIPFGGYVMMAGEDDNTEADEEDWLNEVPASKRLNNKPCHQQIAVMLAGIVMNVLLAWVLFIGLAMAKGYVVEDAKPIVYKVEENSVAQKAGLQKDDHIVEARCGKESIRPETQYDLLEWIQYNHDTIELTVKRDNQTINVNLKPIYDKENSVYLIGYKAIAYARKTHWYEAFGNGTKNLWSSTTSIFTSLSHLIRGQGVENLSGPVGIFTVTKKTAEMGLSSYLSLFAMISLNIGIFNAIPIPALDGGRILIVLIEKIMRRKVNQRLVERIIMASFVFLMLIFVFATYNDIARFL